MRSEVTIDLTDGSDGPKLHLITYLPTHAPKPSPVLLVLGFQPPAATFGDPELETESPGTSLPAGVADMAGAIPSAAFLDAGFGLAAIDYLELDPDSADGYAASVRARFDGVSESSRQPDAWGAVAAWAWGLSRAQDYLETEPAIDKNRVAIYGGHLLLLGEIRRVPASPRLRRRAELTSSLLVRSESPDLSGQHRRTAGGRTHASRPDCSTAPAVADRAL
jgi:hypothetical protein